jgi:tetratricopeptide (TPR) repeat protein
MAQGTDQRLLASLIVFFSAHVASAAPPSTRDDPVNAALALGDAAYARRGEGATGARARTVQIEEAIAAYRRAAHVDPDSPEAVFKLLRALFFLASFCGATLEERRAIYEEGRQIGEAGIQRLERRIGGFAGSARVDALRKIPPAASLYFWTAVCWGEWALARGKLTAARHGAGSRIRDLAQIVVDLDPGLEEGGGYRVLGRLHDQSPRIPFLTGWVSRQEALSNLRKALAIGPRSSVNQLFLAEAILNHDAANREEARRLLTLCATSAPRDEYRAEDTYYADLAPTAFGSIPLRELTAGDLERGAAEDTVNCGGFRSRSSSH